METKVRSERQGGGGGVGPDAPVQVITGTLTTEHAASSYGQPVLLVDGLDNTAYGPDDIVRLQDGGWCYAYELCHTTAFGGDQLAQQFVDDATTETAC